MQRNSLTANTGTTQAGLMAKLLSKDEARRIAVNVLVLLLLGRVATQWNVKSPEAENLRVSVINLGVTVAALIAWFFFTPSLG